MSLIITPPTSSSEKLDHAVDRSLVNTPHCRPKKLSLTRRMASSVSRYGKATASGANASFEQTLACTGTSVRIVGWK